MVRGIDGIRILGGKFEGNILYGFRDPAIPRSRDYDFVMEKAISIF